MSKAAIPGDWQKILAGETDKPYYRALREFVDEEREKGKVYPPAKDEFAALRHTAYGDANVLILGQDPYHGAGQAHGLAFSVQPGVPLPPSLRNIFKELREDIGCPIPNNGYLVPWAEQGVMLLNAVLTVREAEPNSHQGKGWETFTDAIITALSQKETPVVFVLWGAYAGRKAALIDAGKNTIIRSAHPSPLSARNGFFGSRPFSTINSALETNGMATIDWCIPDL
jgi:uracil-DNA glycosylase